MYMIYRCILSVFRGTTSTYLVLLACVHIALVCCEFVVVLDMEDDMALLGHLSDHHMIATLVSVNRPSTARVVIVHDYDGLGEVVCAACRYVNGKWIGNIDKEDIGMGLTDKAIWSESLLGTST